MLWQSIILNGQPRQVERLVRNNLLPLRLKLLRAVLLSHLPEQGEAGVLDTVSVNILNIYHKQFYLLPSPFGEGLGVRLFLYFIPMLIVVIIAHLNVLQYGDGIVGEGG